MEVMEAIMGRRSVRKFTDRAIEDEKIDALKESLIWAPSAGNLQKRAFCFVFDHGAKRRLVDAALGQSFISGAPLVVVACADLTIDEHYGARGELLYCIEDVACSVQNLMLAAHALGLGSVWVGAFDEQDVSRALDLPARLRPVAIVPVGYPAYVPAPPPRVRAKAVITEIR